MAVVENAGNGAVVASNREANPNDVASPNQKSTKPTDQSYHLIQQQQKVSNNHHTQNQKVSDDDGEGFNREMRDLEEMLSKLNPMAEEFVPPSLVTGLHQRMMLAPPHPAAVAAAAAGHFGFNTNGFLVPQHVNSAGLANGNSFRRVSVFFLPTVIIGDCLCLWFLAILSWIVNFSNFHLFA